MTHPQIVERMDVHPENIYYHEHVARYQFVLSQHPAGPILDIATGTGYGADLLDRTTHLPIVGVDVDWPALQTARATYPQPQILFLRGDGTALPFLDHRFATIVSFETIEHIHDDHQFLHELTRMLTPDGHCFLSTPNRAHSQRHGRVNPYHVREYLEDELSELLSGYFGKVSMFYQGFGESYQHDVDQYKQDIQAQKQQLPGMLRFAIRYIYHPIKSRIPAVVTNYVIERMLHLQYPQPTVGALTIATTPLADTSGFLVWCEQPRPL